MQRTKQLQGRGIGLRTDKDHHAGDIVNPAISAPAFHGLSHYPVACPLHIPRVPERHHHFPCLLISYLLPHSVAGNYDAFVLGGQIALDQLRLADHATFRGHPVSHGTTHGQPGCVPMSRPDPRRSHRFSFAVYTVRGLKLDSEPRQGSARPRLRRMRALSSGRVGLWSRESAVAVHDLRPSDCLFSESRTQRESPTFAQTSLLPIISTVTAVEPLYSTSKSWDSSSEFVAANPSFINALHPPPETSSGDTVNAECFLSILSKQH